jgi:hypothetical protein
VHKEFLLSAQGAQLLALLALVNHHVQSAQAALIQHEQVSRNLHHGDHALLSGNAHLAGVL